MTEPGSGAKSSAGPNFWPVLIAYLMKPASADFFDELCGTIAYVNVLIGYAFLYFFDGLTMCS